MSRLSNVLCLALASLLLLGPGSIDLCACSAGGHGVFCEDAAAPEGEPSCCSAAVATDESHEDGCDCPVLDLESPTPKVEGCDEAQVPLPLADNVALAWRDVAAPAQPVGCVEQEPRPPPLRRHLLLNVCLC